ncbi:MAG TPA: DUF6256 family protein [Streptosporangiaceae bacterium]|nr:DUF6256 family protein [Streptosporangiaceae bacterium]
MAPDGILALTTADRQALIPMSAGYLILMTALGFGLRRLYRPRGAPSGAEPSPGQGEQPGQAPPAPPGQGEQPEQAPATPPGRAPASPPGPGQRTGRAALARQIASTVIGGYLLLMAVIVAYYFGVARVGPGFLESALTGTALLLGLAAPVFVALSWLAERRGRS